ncbi:hypothetical protein PVK06_035829 [Gossypium arboreum]|uniref:DUF4238 domain-containing protein n=1 Tax=Gossypium arboreum TaxID=29729 RepID=A0ABR0NI94_GOSAR|nr:hypothetical protein PVK06_035829 [Gossypium arboreum]
MFREDFSEFELQDLMKEMDWLFDRKLKPQQERLVSKDLIYKLQLHYLPHERRFHLIKKGKVENEIKPQTPKGKQGKEFLAIESRQSHLNVVEKIAEDLVCERTPHLDLINYHFLIVNDFSLTSGMKSFSHDLYCVGKSVGEVRLTRRPQNLIMFDKEFSYETLSLFDCDGDNLEWFPPKEGGHKNNMFPFRTICGSPIFGNESVRIMNKGVRDNEKFLASKWLV